MLGKQEWVLIVLTVIGMIAAAYAISLHYAPAGSSFCNISDTFDCDKVNKSPWAKLLGIPVSILGLISYLGVFLLVLKRKLVQRTLSFTDKDFWQYMALIVTVMLLFQLYLTGIEIVKLHAYCIACLVSQAVTLFMATDVYLRLMRF